MGELIPIRFPRPLPHLTWEEYKADVLQRLQRMGASETDIANVMWLLEVRRSVEMQTRRQRQTRRRTRRMPIGG